MTAPRSDTPAGQRLLAEWKGKRPERHAGVSGEAQKRALARARTRDAAECGNGGRAQQSERQGPQAPYPRVFFTRGVPPDERAAVEAHLRAHPLPTGGALLYTPAPQKR